jgi:hypothetical protein
MLLVGTVAPLAAQAPGIPVKNAGVVRGITLSAMAGVPNDAAGGGTAFLVGAGLGARRVGVAGFASVYSGADFADGTFAGLGANFTYRLVGGPLIPLALNFQAGAAYYSPSIGGSQGGYPAGAKAWHVPVGVSLSLAIAQPVVAIRPWIAPRLDYTRARGPDPLADPLPGGSLPMVTTTATELAGSVGVTFGFLNGLGIDLALDRVFADSPGGKPLTFGVGLTYTLK